MTRVSKVVAGPIFSMFRSRWEQTIFSIADLEEQYCQRMAANTVPFHLFLVAMFFISMMGSCIAAFGAGVEHGMNTANFLASIAMWFIHFVWLISLRSTALPIRVVVKVVPVIVLILDVLILAAANPEAQNYWSRFDAPLSCNDFWADGRCFRYDFWLNAVTTSGIITVSGIYLLPFRQSLFAVPAAWAFYIVSLKVCRSGTALMFFAVSEGNHERPAFASGVSLLLYFCAVILALRYASESCDRELFWTNKMQSSAAKAQEDMISASRKLCCSVFDMVFFLKQDSLEFCDASHQERLVKALRVGNRVDLECVSFLNFLYDEEERQRFYSHMQESSFDELTEERAGLPAQLITVRLKDGSGLSVSTKVYCTRFQRLNFKHPFDAPEEFLLIGLTWEGTSPTVPLQQLEQSAPDSTIRANMELLERRRSKQSSQRKPSPSSNKKGPLQGSTSHELLTSIPEDLRSNCTSVRSEGAHSAPPATQFGLSNGDDSSPTSQSSWKMRPLGKQKLSPDSSSSASSTGSSESSASQLQIQDSQPLTQVPAFLLTPHRTKTMVLLDIMRAWNCKRLPVHCCAFHTSIKDLQKLVRSLAARPCDPCWTVFSEQQCDYCLSMFDSVVESGDPCEYCSQRVGSPTGTPTSPALEDPLEEEDDESLNHKSDNEHTKFSL